MLYQLGANAIAVNHVEHAGRDLLLLSGPFNRLRGQLCGDHMAAVRLEHDRATRSQCGRRVPACGGERQRKVAGAEHRYRADSGAILPQIRAW
ncbi:hypothetical protein D3C80_1555040 [compost metagenome]